MIGEAELRDLHGVSAGASQSPTDEGRIDGAGIARLDLAGAPKQTVVPVARPDARDRQLGGAKALDAPNRRQSLQIVERAVDESVPPSNASRRRRDREAITEDVDGLAGPGANAAGLAAVPVPGLPIARAGSDHERRRPVLVEGIGQNPFVRRVHVQDGDARSLQREPE